MKKNSPLIIFLVGIGLLGYWMNQNNVVPTSVVVEEDSWKSTTNFPTVFQIKGPCTFNGITGNITGENCKPYIGKKYIDTGISLYSKENYEKDYEIYFEIVDYSPKLQDSSDSQQTIMNEKLELSKENYPGIAFRRSGNNLEITERIKNQKKSVYKNYQDIYNIRLTRKDKKVYYSINEGETILLQDLTNLYQPFDTPVWFGASLSENGEIFRIFRGKLENIYIKMGIWEET